MPKIKHRVKLTEQERLSLLEIIKDCHTTERKLDRAYVLLKAHKGLYDREIAKDIGINIATVAAIRKRFVKGRLAAALHERPRPGGVRKINEQIEQSLISLLNQPPPDGKKRWTLTLLASHIGEGNEENIVSHEAIRYTMKRLNLSLKRSSVQLTI